MQNLNQVLITFIQGAVDIPDPQVCTDIKIRRYGTIANATNICDRPNSK